MWCCRVLLVAVVLCCLARGRSLLPCTQQNEILRELVIHTLYCLLNLFDKLESWRHHTVARAPHTPAPCCGPAEAPRASSSLQKRTLRLRLRGGSLNLYFARAPHTPAAAPPGLQLRGRLSLQLRGRLSLQLRRCRGSSSLH